MSEQRALKSDYRRLPLETLHAIAEHGAEVLQQPVQVQAVAAFVAGGFITLGAALSVFLSMGQASAGIANLLLGLGFVSGFFLVVTTGAALFTEVNVMIPVFLLSMRKTRRACPSEQADNAAPVSSVCIKTCLRFWVVVWTFNLLGALFVGGMMKAGNVLTYDAEERLDEIMAGKIDKFKDNGAQGWFQVVASAFLGNWLVGMAALLATSARTLSGKAIGIFFPVLAFVSLGVQHSPANMGYFCIGLIALDESPITWGEAFGWNLVPASIGNLFGGGIMVALVFYYMFLHHDEAICDAIYAKGKAKDKDHVVWPSKDAEQA